MREKGDYLWGAGQEEGRIYSGKILIKEVGEEESGIGGQNKSKALGKFR